MSSELREVAHSVKPVPLQEYLRSRGWKLQEDLSQSHGIVSYERDGISIDVPQRTDFADYPRRIAELLALVAELEERSPLALVEDLIQPAGDVLGVRVDSEAARSGTLSLLESLRLREGAKNLLLASAHSVMTPLAYFPRLTRSEPAALLASVREGQNQRGSFIARFIVPTEPVIGAQTTQVEDAFGRRVMGLLMQALNHVYQVRSLGAYDDLLSMADLGVSGNLLAALHAMRGSIGAGTLELTTTWARNRKPPEQIPSRVAFPAESLEGLDAVAEQMRSQAQTKRFSVHGFVNSLG